MVDRQRAPSREEEAVSVKPGPEPEADPEHVCRWVALRVCAWNEGFA